MTRRLVLVGEVASKPRMIDHEILRFRLRLERGSRGSEDYVVDTLFDLARIALSQLDQGQRVMVVAEDTGVVESLAQFGGRRSRVPLLLAEYIGRDITVASEPFRADLTREED